jgi:hypothetical protein
MCVICKAAKTKVLVSRSEFTSALGAYHRQKDARMIVLGGLMVGDFYEFVGFGGKDLRKYHNQRHKVKVPLDVATKIRLIANNSNWYALCKMMDAKK